MAGASPGRPGRGPPGWQRDVAAPGVGQPAPAQAGLGDHAVGRRKASPSLVVTPQLGSQDSDWQEV